MESKRHTQQACEPVLRALLETRVLILQRMRFG